MSFLKPLFVALLLMSFVNSKAGNDEFSHFVVNTFGENERIYHWQRFYMAGQPSLGELEELKEQGITTIINLRGEEENEDFALEAFDEEKIARAMGFHYHSIPVAGYRDYTPEKLEAFARAIEKSEGELLIHCSGASRVTYFMMAWLISYQQVDRKTAEYFGDQMTYTNYVDLLLKE